MRNSLWRARIQGTLLGLVLGAFLLCAAWPAGAQQSIKSFLGVQGKRLGETVTLPYNGDLFTASDGTVWKSGNANPLAYSAAYAGLLTDAPYLVTSAVTLGAPFTGGLWQGFSSRGIIGPTAGGSTWVMMHVSGAAGLDYYFTSTDAGATWTKRTPPVAGKGWHPLWDGTNYVIYAGGTGATGVQESTDGINWTARTAIAITSLSELLYNGSVYLAFPNSGTTAATSPDRATWTSRTVSAASFTANPRCGNVTWNAGAGLFIAPTTTQSTYQTSPDGATWTTRTGLDGIPALNGTTGTYGMASNATLTLTVGPGGIYATSTDGINWTARGPIDPAFSIPSQASGSPGPQCVAFDGTRFVVYMANNVFYSSTGTGGWIRNVRALGAPPIFLTPIGFVTTRNSNVMMHTTDVTSSAANNILTVSAGSDTAAVSYTRIK